MTSLVITFCEGPHDAAFLYKILRYRGLKPYSRKIKEMPELLRGYIISQMKKTQYEDINLENIKPPLPTILSENDTYFLLYAVGGDKNADKTRKIVDGFIKARQLYEKQPYNYAFTFFYDADKQGVQYRVDYIKKHFKNLLGNLDGLEHNEIVTTPTARIGCFVFSKDGSSGRLEDILLPLMKEDNKPIFEDAEQYIEKHSDKKRLKRKDHFNSDKAVIGIAGQLQRSGCTNTVIIQHADYLSKEKIENNDKCGEICTFFDKFRPIHHNR